jgi:hypothetical protein
MVKRMTGLVIGLIFLVNISGCFFLAAGAAGGVGTSVWLGDKLSQEVNASFDRCLKATGSALKSMNLEITKETVKEDVAQFMSKYTDGKTIWIDIHRITEKSSKIEVRVGAVNADKVASDKILKKIQGYL